MAKPSLIREELRRAWHELRGGDQTPARTAIAVALGLFIGSLPIFGTHTPLVLVLCLVFRLDTALCWVASNISNPLFAVFLINAEIQVGSYVLTGRAASLDLERMRALGAWERVAYAFDEFGPALAAGAPLVAAGLALAGGLVVYGATSVRRRFRPVARRERYRLRADAPPWWHAIERLAGRYAPDYETSPRERSRFHYVRVKLLMDPVTRQLADLEGDTAGVLGDVLDVGTGRGQLPLLLIELGRATAARGVDWDEDKIGAARAAARQPPALPARFELADAGSAELPDADTVLLIDLLHYLTIEEQDALLDRAARAVRPGGRLCVREADSDRGWRSFMTLAEERFFTAIRFNRGARVRFRPARDIAARLERHGLSCHVVPAWGRTPFSNVLIVGRRATST